MKNGCSPINIFLCEDLEVTLILRLAILLYLAEKADRTTLEEILSEFPVRLFRSGASLMIHLNLRRLQVFQRFLTARTICLIFQAVFAKPHLAVRTPFGFMRILHFMDFSTYRAFHFLGVTIEHSQGTILFLSIFFYRRP